MDLGSKLRTLRKQNHLTLQQLANNLNDEYNDTKFGKGRLSRWENNKDDPALSSIKMLSDFYNISVDYFMDKAGSIEKYRLDNNKLNDVKDYFSKLIPRRQDVVLQFIKKQFDDQIHHN